MAFFKLETLKIKHHLNHFALKSPNYGIKGLNPLFALFMEAFQKGLKRVTVNNPRLI